MNIQQLIQEKSVEHNSLVISWRRHLHQYPELSWQEFETANFIEKTLAEIGITHVERIAGTGVVALIHGEKEEKNNCVALRADIDALPIQEKNDITYCSKNEQVMHACGHDAHTATLLGAAKILHETKAHWSGIVKCIFQPSEEKTPSGAEALIKAGVLENPAVSAIIGGHVTPEILSGTIGFKSGMFMASADEIYITIHGKGGHAAAPHQVVDPILISAHVILALQQIVSRNANPTTPSVLSFGDIQGNGATNIIPEKVTLKGTLRTFDEVWRKTAHEKIKKITTELCESMGATCTVEIPAGLPFVFNNEALTAELKQDATMFFGEDKIVEMPLRMGAEDFAFYTHHIPACFIRIGTGKDDATKFGLHNPHFNIDEEALQTATALFSWLAVQQLIK